jgi:hypothetical protein
MNNKNIIKAMRAMLLEGYCYAEFEQYENRLDGTKEELLEAENLLKKFIDHCEKKLK